jgi:hypothetical protein
MSKRWLSLLGLLLLSLLVLHGVLLAQDRPRVTQGGKNTIEADTMEGSLSGREGKMTCRGHVVFTAEVQPKTKGQAGYRVTGTAELLTSWGAKAQGSTAQRGMMRLEKAKGVTPTLTIVNSATRDTHKLMADVIEYHVERQALQASGNVSVSSSKNAVKITCQRLETRATAQGQLDAIVAQGNVTFSGQQAGDDGKAQRVEGTAGLATYSTVSDIDGKLMRLLQLEKGAKGPLPHLVVTNLETQERVTDGSAPFIEHNLDTGEYYLGKEKRPLPGGSE